jgi:hypothetical protein
MIKKSHIGFRFLTGAGIHASKTNVSKPYGTRLAGLLIGVPASVVQ